MAQDFILIRLLCCTAHVHRHSDIKARRVLLVLPKEEGSDVQPSPQVVDTWTALQTAQLRKLDLVCGEFYIHPLLSACALIKHVQQPYLVSTCIQKVCWKCFCRLQQRAGSLYATIAHVLILAIHAVDAIQIS
jgi:hypothetical protein